MIFQGREIEDLSKPFQTGDILPVDEIESLVAGDSHTQGAVGRFGLLHRLRQVGRAMVKKAIDVDRGLDRFGDTFDPSLTLKLLVECQSQVAGGHFQLFQSGKIAEAGRLRRLARLTQVSEMRFGSDLVENDPGNADVGIEMLEAIDQGSDRKGGRAGIDQQYHGDVERAGQLGAAAEPLVVAVEQSHDTLGDQHLRVGAIFAVDRLEMGHRSQPTVEVDRWAMGRLGVKLWVDVIRPAFERLRFYTFII